MDKRGQTFSLETVVSLVIHSIIFLAVISIFVLIILTFTSTSESSSAINELNNLVDFLNNNPDKDTYKLLIVPGPYEFVGFSKGVDKIRIHQKPNYCGSKACICLYHIFKNGDLELLECGLLKSDNIFYYDYQSLYNGSKGFVFNYKSKTGDYVFVPALYKISYSKEGIMFKQVFNTGDVKSGSISQVPTFWNKLTSLFS